MVFRNSKLINRLMIATAIALTLTFSFPTTSLAQSTSLIRKTYTGLPIVVDLNIPGSVTLKGSIQGTTIAKYLPQLASCNINRSYAPPTVSSTSRIYLDSAAMRVGTAQCLSPYNEIIAQANAKVNVTRTGEKIYGSLSTDGYVQFPYIYLNGSNLSATSDAKIEINNIIVKPPSSGNISFPLTFKTSVSESDNNNLALQSNDQNYNTNLPEIASLQGNELAEAGTVNNSEKTANKVVAKASFNIHNPLTNDSIIEGDLLKIEGVYRGDINLDRELINFKDVESGTLSIEFPGRYTNKKGKLFAKFEQGCLTQAQADGVFEGWLPPVETCGDFSINRNTTPNFSDFNFDLRLPSFSKPIDLTLGFTQDNLVGAPNSQEHYFLLSNLLDYLKARLPKI